jgi:hypothetical protein
MEAASPLPQKVVVAGAVKVLVAKVDGAIVIVTEALELEQAPEVTILLK